MSTFVNKNSKDQPRDLGVNQVPTQIYKGDFIFIEFNNFSMFDAIEFKDTGVLVGPTPSSALIEFIFQTQNLQSA